MSVTESQLREQYRNASDEQLLFLAQQESSEYTDVAWRLLQEEITRRALTPKPGTRGAQIGEEGRAEEVFGALPLGRWGEVPDTGHFEEFSDDELLAFAEQCATLYSRISDELIRRGRTAPALGDLAWTDRDDASASWG